MTPLEKAARAIIDLDGRHGLAYTEAEANRMARRYARAVLMAVRDLDDDTRQRGSEIFCETKSGLFDAMIDAILSEPQP